ncbi:hypothetical protein GCM10009414_28540 [Tatumella terrea]|uniref:tail protein (tape measure) n=1 Tax=Tatumella terrea TaxID=419007 RepID=UPI0031CE992D
MADSQNAGSIYFDVDIDTAKLLTSAKQVDSTLDNMASAAQSTGKSLDSMSKDSKSAASSLTQIASSTKSVDGSMQTLNTTVSAMAIAIQQANASSAAASMTLAQMQGAMNSLIGAANSIAEAMRGAGTSTGTASSEFSRAESIIEGLGNQLAILDEAQENGARSAAILAAQLRAGSGATDAEKDKIGDLTGQLYDMKNGTDAGAKSHVNWKHSMQQAGYQVQDFIVQVQGGQSAILAFSEQGSQLAGAFGPGGAVVGAIIALGSVIVGTLVKSMGNAEDTMKDLATATNALDQVVTVSQGGVAALSDKYALLAKTNAEAATILRNQALIEYNQAISKLPDAITDASTSLFGLGDSAKAAFSGGMVGISAFNDILQAANIQTSSVSEAFRELSSNAGISRGSIATFSATIGALSSNFGISEQQAFDLAKQLENVSQTKSPEALQALVLQLQSIKSSTTDGQAALTTFIGKLVDLVTTSANAKANVSALKGEMDNLTAGQKNLIQQSQRDLALSKLQGTARARLQALYKSEDAGFSADSPQALQMQNEAEQTYKNTQAVKDNQKAKKNAASEAKRLAASEASIAQKLEQMRQQSDLNAVSSQNLTLEQAKLRAEMSLGKNATAAQREEAAKYAEAIWQQSAALKARNLIPEVAENDDYTNKSAQLELLKGQKDAQGNLIISQQQYQQASEKLAAEHISNLDKINSQSVVTPQQSLAGQVDPVQQLANENAQKLALIQQFTQQKVLTEQQGLALMNAANTQYEQQRTAAQWTLLSQQGTGYSAMTAGFDAFADNASNALTGILTGTMSVSDAMKSLGNTVLNAVINSFVQAGAEWVRQMIIQQTMGSAVSAATMGEAAMVSTAWAPAAAMASLATLGGNAAPAMAGISSTVGLYQGLALTGMRKNGGPVSPGGLYQVGESGLPEIYKASNGSQYMIPGDNGSVLSNKDITGGNSSGVSVTHVVNNYASGVNVQNQTTQNGSQVLIETFLTDMESGGPMSSSVQSTFGLSRKATGDY